VPFLALLSLGALCCDSGREREQVEPPRIEQNPSALTPLGTREALPGVPPSPISGAGTPEATANERPSIGENMGRGFQGSLELQARSPAGTRGLHYMTRGNKARLQVDSLHGKGGFDALVWDENISVLDNAHQTYRTFALAAVQPKDGPDTQVVVKKTGERTSLQGVLCERYEMTEGPLHISACVSGLPGSFAVDKFEAISGLDVPAWVEQLLKDELLPLQASARDTQGREVYTLELIQYSAGPVDPALLALPQSYRKQDANADLGTR